MHKVPSFLLILCLLPFFFLTGCQSVDKIAGNSKGYSSFRFIDTGPAADDRFEEPAAARDKVAQAAIRSMFDENGFNFSDSADLMVAYLFIRQNNVSTTVVPTYYGLGHDKIQSAAHRKGVLKGEQREYFDKGAVVIDVIDVRTQKIIYRNWAVKDVRGTDENERLTLIESAIDEALSPFFD